MSTTYFYNRDTAVTFDEGSAASPSLSFAGDSDTGLYSGGTANVVRIAVGGTEKARFSVNGLAVYDGNMYIESGYKLNFDLNVSNNYYLQKSSTTLYMHSPVNLSLQTNGNHRLYINQTGQVGIGTTTPASGYSLDVNGLGKFSSSVRVDNVESGNPVPSATDEARFSGYGIIGNRGTFYVTNPGGNVQIGAGGGGAHASNRNVEFMVDKAVFYKNVGIKNTSPGYDLDVTGNIHATGYYAISNNIVLEKTASYTMLRDANGIRKIYLGGTADPTTYLNGDNFRFRNGSGSTVYMAINTSGNVGIGTTSPSEKLDVRNGTLTVRDDSNVNYVEIDRFAGITLKGNGTAHKTIQTPNTDALAFGTNSTERMRITSDGNVAIGTTTSSYRLTIQGSNNGINLGGTGAYLRWNSGDMQIKNEGGYKMGFYTYNTTATSLINRMVIDTDGNVGIGSTTPDAKLTVQSDTADSTVFAVDGVNGRLFSVDDTLSDSLFSVNTIAGLPVIEAFADNTVKMGAFNQNDLVISGSKVGIGTDAPTDKLHIHDSTSGDTPRIHFTNSGTGTGSSDGAYVGLGNGDDLVLLNYESGGHTDFYTAGNNRMRISNTGNVGIGTTGPASKLHVYYSSAGGVSPYADGITVERSGRVALNLLSPVANDSYIFFGNPNAANAGYVGYENNTNRLVLKSNGYASIIDNTGEAVRVTNGNVGIGTSTPSVALDVVGDLKATGAYINGASDNSGKSDFSVLTGGTASLALTGGELRVGDTDVNWAVALRSNGTLGTYGQALSLSTSAGNYAVNIVSNGITAATFDQNIVTLYKPTIIRGGAPNPETTDGYGLEIMGNYTDGRWNHRFVKHDDGAGVPLYVQKTTSTANVWSNTARFGSYSGNTNEFEVFGNAGVTGDFAVGDDLSVGSAGNGRINVGSIGVISGESTSIFRLESPGDIHFNADTNANQNGVILFKESNNTKFEVNTSGANVYGDLTVGGTITAQEFRTEFVTQTVIFESGSTAFGNSADDTHTFTGNMTVNTPADNSIGNGVRINRPGNYYGGFEFAQNNSVDWSFGVNSNGFGIYENGAAATTRLAIKDGGNVGIGTTSPSDKLHVNSGDIRIDGGNNHLIVDHGSNSGSAGVILQGTGSNIPFVRWTDGTTITAGIRANSSGDLRIQTNGFNDRLTINSSGNVGIGTTNPIQKLQVAGSAYVNGGTLFLDTNQFIRWGNSNQGIKAVNDGSMSFVTGGSEKMTLEASGRLGINTTVPSAYLHIAGGHNSARSQITYTHNSDPAAIESSQLLQWVSEPGITYNGAGIGANINTSGQHYGRYNNTLPYGVYLRFDPVNGYSEFHATTGNSGVAGGQGARVFRVGPTGNVDTYGDLRMNGGTFLSDDGVSHYVMSQSNLYLYSGASATMTLAAGGNVGIGTTSPAFKLDVQGGTRIQGADSNSTISDYGIFAIENQQREGIGFGYDADGNTAWIYAREVGVTSRKLNVQGSVFIDNYGGNVGIGTSSPSNKLDVAGGAEFNGETYIRGTSNIGLRIQATDQGIGGSDGLRVGINATHAFVWNYENTPLSFGTNGSQKATILANGNVGIGTTSPTTKLDVKGTAMFVNVTGNSYNENIRLPEANSGYSSVVLGGPVARTSGTGTDQWTILKYPSDQFAIRNNNSDKLNIETNGNVGIGTASPARRVHIAGAGGSSGGLMLSPTSGDVEVQFQDSGTTNAYITLKDGTQQMRFRDDSANVLNVDFGTERVGIMTTTPQKVLDVYLGTNSAVASIGGLISSGEYAGLHFGYSETGNSNYRHSAIVFERDDAAFGDARGNIHILNSPSGSASADLGDARLTILPSGNVGIGTTSPNAKLEVYGSGSTVLDIQGSQGQLFSVTDSLTGSLMSVNDISGLPILEVFDTDKVVMGEFGSDALVVTGSKVGVGTDTPDTNLHIHGEGGTGVVTQIKVTQADDGAGHPGAAAILQSSGWGEAYLKLGGHSAYAGGGDFNIQSAADLAFKTGGTATRMFISNSGNVGIGTTSPGVAFDVVGTQRITGDIRMAQVNPRIDYDNGSTSGALRFWSTSGNAERMRINSNGNVGIGTTSPDEKLHIADGNLKVSSSSPPEIILTYTGGTANYARIKSVDNSGYLEAAIEFNNGDILFKGSNGAEVMRLDQYPGYLGIGTTSPSEQLHLTGNIRIDGGTLKGNTAFQFLTTSNAAQLARFGGIQVSTSYGGTPPYNGILFHTDNQLQRTAADQLTYSTTGGAGYFLPGANPGYFLGRDDRRWEIVFCNILDSAGLHEKNLENPEGEKSVGDYATGTVLVWKGGKNVPCTVEADHMRMGIAVEGMSSPLVQGAEPVLVTGIANEGDYLICSEKEGHARAISREEMLERNLFDCVLGKALESGNGESYLLKVWITI